MLASCVEGFFSSAPGGAILPSRPAQWCGGRAQRRSRTAARRACRCSAYGLGFGAARNRETPLCASRGMAPTERSFQRTARWCRGAAISRPLRHWLPIRTREAGEHFVTVLRRPPGCAILRCPSSVRMPAAGQPATQRPDPGRRRRIGSTPVLRRYPQMHQADAVSIIDRQSWQASAAI